MATTLIVLIIAGVIINKIRNRNILDLPEKLASRHLENVEQIRPNYAFSRGEDGPLPGPWQTSPRSEDRPLSGPWNGPTHSELPGRLEPERATEVEGKSQPPFEWEDESGFSRRQNEQTNPVVDPPSEPVDQDRLRQSLKTVGGGMSRPTDQSGNLLQPFSAATSGRRKRNAGSPMAAALRSKNALVGSMIMGEVLNLRGGRMKKGFKQW